MSDLGARVDLAHFKLIFMPECPGLAKSYEASPGAQSHVVERLWTWHQVEWWWQCASVIKV